MSHKRIGCGARFEGTMILGRRKNKTACISLEAYHIKKFGNKCSSTLSLFDAEFYLLDAVIGFQIAKEN